MHRVGVISDTHRLIRPGALEAMQGVEQIIHAGDIGWPAVIEELQKIAPVTAVRGNVDAGDWVRNYPLTAVAEIHGFFFYVIHDIKNLDLDPRAAGFAAVISGHSHTAKKEFHNGVLYFNPGSAGPRRFHMPVTVGILLIQNGLVTSEIIQLDV